MADPLNQKAACTVMQFATDNSNDAAVERDCLCEVTDLDDSIVELAFNIRPGRQRTYLRLLRSDLLRMIALEN